MSTSAITESTAPRQPTVDRSFSNFFQLQVLLAKRRPGLMHQLFGETASGIRENGLNSV
jgi:hypothetical protein